MGWLEEEEVLEVTRHHRMDLMMGVTEEQEVRVDFLPQEEEPDDLEMP